MSQSVQLLRVDIGKLKAEREDCPPEYEKWGGRGLIARLLSEEVPATCYPLGESNKLVFAVGLLAGVGVPNAGRLSVGGKSPLTSTIKESNAGGTAAERLARLGIRAIVVEGKPAPSHWYLLLVKRNSAELLPADAYGGLGNYGLAEQLHAQYGKELAIISIGPAGELGLGSAAVAVTDIDGVPCRFAARGGLGALMGDKGLKAILIEDAAGQMSIAVRDRQALREAIRRFAKVILAHPMSGKELAESGTAGYVMRSQTLGALPTRNFSRGTFEKAEDISGATLRALIEARGGAGKTGHICMPGCIMRCSNVVPDETGQPLVGPLEYETIVFLGSNLGISSLDEIARLNRLCNDYGMDTIEVGGAIGVAMEAGLLEWGDSQRAAELLEEARKGTPLGRLIGSGTATTGRVLGVPRTPAVKGQCLSGYDPRAAKGYGVAYATSTMGADHTAGAVIWPIDPRSPEQQAEGSRDSQIKIAVYDSLGLCAFMLRATVEEPSLLTDMLKAVYGTDLDGESLWVMGKEVLKLERRFNRVAGFGSGTDRLPEFFRTEKLPPDGLVFDVPDEKLDWVLDFDDDRGRHQ